MARMSNTLMFLLLAAAVVSSTAAASSSNSSTVTFYSANACPPASQLTSLRSASPVCRRACSVECAASSNCSAFVHVDDTCRLAGNSDWQDVWTSDTDCSGAVAQFKEPKVSSELTKDLRLRYSFRYSLRCLQVDDSSCPAAVLNGGATRDIRGIQLDRSKDSYVGIDVAGGLESLRGSDNQFTVFVKVRRNITEDSKTFLVRSTADSVVNTFVLAENVPARSFFICSRPIHVAAFETTAVAPETDSVMSVAVTYDTEYHFYLNGVGYPMIEGSNCGSSSEVGRDVRLGMKRGASGTAMSGRFFCFAVWTRALSAEELKEFADNC